MVGDERLVVMGGCDAELLVYMDASHSSQPDQ